MLSALLILLIFLTLDLQLDTNLVAHETMLGYDLRDRLREAIDTPENVDKIETRLEDIDGVFYIYNKHSDEFLAQGANASDLLQQIKHRFANHEIVISAGEPHAIKRFKESSIT